MSEFRLKPWHAYRFLHWMLPGLATYYGERARLHARRHAKKGDTGLVISARFPPGGTRSPRPAPGYGQLYASVDYVDVGTFYAIGRKRPVWVPRPPGVARVHVDAFNTTSLATFNVVLQEHQVRIVYLYPRLLFALRQRSAAVEVVDEDMRVIERVLEPESRQQ